MPNELRKCRCGVFPRQFPTVSSAGEDAFTILELLISLAVIGLLMVALTTFLFSMGELWGRNTDVHLFDQHVNAVTRFLSNELRTAAYPPSAKANATPITVVQVTPASGSPQFLLTFDLIAGSRILSWPDAPLPEVVCSLQERDNEGLFLLWHSRLEMRYATDPPRELLLTPFVTAMSYDYYDETFKKWTTETALRNTTGNQAIAPQRLRLTFTYRKMTRQTVIPIPSTPQGMPNF